MEDAFVSAAISSWICVDMFAAGAVLSKYQAVQYLECLLCYVLRVECGSHDRRFR